MQVVLLKDVRGVGRKDEVKEVSDGYALNSLIPQGAAVQATKHKLAEVVARHEQQKTELAAKQERLDNALRLLGGRSIVVKAKANQQGHLFKGISVADVAQLLGGGAGVPISDEMIHGVNGTIKHVGTYVLRLKTSTHAVELTLVVERQA